MHQSAGEKSGAVTGAFILPSIQTCGFWCPTCQNPNVSLLVFSYARPDQHAARGVVTLLPRISDLVVVSCAAEQASGLDCPGL
jgi:hypothetical protein